MIQGARNANATPIMRTLHISAPAPCSIVRRMAIAEVDGSFFELPFRKLRCRWEWQRDTSHGPPARFLRQVTRFRWHAELVGFDATSPEFPELP